MPFLLAACARTTIACRFSNVRSIGGPCCVRPPPATTGSSSGPIPPHARHTKEAACGCAGCYTAHAALELYAEAFASAGALDRLEAFASFNGADFYGLPRNTDQVTLEQAQCRVPDTYAYAEGEALVPLRAGEWLPWRFLA